MALRKLWDRWQPMDGAPRAARVLLACVAVSSAAGLVSAPSALGETKRVTFAARVCDSYANVFANEARNNIMESLKQLGPNTPYSSTAQMDPITEDLPPQGPAAGPPAVPAHCAPLVGWRFTMGTSGDGDKVSGDFGRLSTVACSGEPSCADNQFPTPVATEASVPMLNTSGVVTTPGATVKGAVTINLSSDESDRASNNSLWVMGGTRAAPVGDAKTYAFAALRCATDNLNGDNVEFVSMPTGVQHVYCFAYYVSPPKGSGTIIVRKVVNGTGNQRVQTVNFKGNISFANDNPSGDPDGGTFSVATAAATAATGAGQATPFVREAGSSWNVREVLTASSPLHFDGVACTSTGNPTTGVKSPITIPDTNADRPNGVAIALVDGDTVTCTFTNTYVPPAAGLVLEKISRNRTGTFGFGVTGPGLEGGATRTIETTAVNTTATATRIETLAGEDYRIAEDLPSSDAGTWELTSVVCNDKAITARPVVVRMPTGEKASQRCTFTNTFTPKGVIRIHKVTLGGTAATTFGIEDGNGARFTQTATPTAPGLPATTAVPDTDADRTTALPLGAYTIQETAPVAPAGSDWRLEAVVCNGRVPEASAAASIQIALTADEPEVDCTFTDRLVARPEPPPLPPPVAPPPAITPLPPPNIVVAGITARSDPVPKADLIVTKVATPSSVVLGSTVRYVVQVRNRGPATARNVTLVERTTPITRFLRLRTDRGSCRGAIPRRCTIGTLRAGETATVTVDVRTRRAGTFTNIVAANTSTEVKSLRTMSARARIRVLRAAGARFTG